MAIRRHADTVMRVCKVHLHQQTDCDDAFQETFLRYAQSESSFRDEEHVKAWLIRVATNVCRDFLKRVEASNSSLDGLIEAGDFKEPVGDGGDAGQKRLEARELMEALHRIDERYRIVLYLKYYEGYTAAQISEAIGRPENTVYSDIARGKRELKEVLEHGVEA